METAPEQKVKKGLIALVGVLIALIVAGLVWLFKFAPAEQSGLGWYLFSYATGLTMIVLPCTLPLAFVIVPLSMGKGVRKGLGIALAFAIGVTVTLSLYGAVAALVGKFAVSSLGAPLETVKNWVYFIAGIFAYLFALGEVGLLKLRMPSYTGAAPAFIQKQGDFIKPLLLGLFLGNIGVGCPHPATPMLLIEAGVNGNVFYGWSLFLIHALGRVTPLILLAVLGVAGVNGLSWLIARKDKIERATGWAMVFVAGFILVLGLFTHDWWVNSGIHTKLEALTQEEMLLNILGAQLGTGNAHHHGFEVGQGLFGLPLSWGSTVMVILWLIPIWWWWARERKKAMVIPAEATTLEKPAALRVVSAKKWSFVALSALLALVFIQILPAGFLMQSKMSHEHAVTLHEEEDVTDGLVVRMTTAPTTPGINQVTDLNFSVLNLPDQTPVDDLVIEHEKRMHVIAVRDDLTNFIHVHPNKITPGNWNVKGMFREAGKYKAWTDVTRADGAHTFGHPLVGVADEAGIVPPSKTIIPNFERVVVSGGYYVTLKTDSAVVVNKASNLGFDIRDAVGNIVPLENFLGVKMHLAIIKDDLSVFIHTHPSDHDMGHMSNAASTPRFVFINTVFADAGHDHMMSETEMPAFTADVPFQVTFPKTGIYKLFGQFRPEGIAMTDDQSLVAEFFVEVVEKAPVTPGSTPVGMLVAVSLILMALLSVGVQKYINMPVSKS